MTLRDYLRVLRKKGWGLRGAFNIDNAYSVSKRSFRWIEAPRKAIVDQSCDLSRNYSRSLTSMPISKHNFEIPVDNYVVKNKHAVLLMNRPF